MNIINKKDDNHSLVNQKETETVKVSYSESKTETRNDYKIVKTDGTEIEGTKITTNNYKRWEYEGKADQVLKKIGVLEKSPELQPKNQVLRESLETKVPEIIKETQTSQENFS